MQEYFSLGFGVARGLLALAAAVTAVVIFFRASRDDSGLELTSHWGGLGGGIGGWRLSRPASKVLIGVLLALLAFVLMPSFGQGGAGSRDGRANASDAGQGDAATAREPSTTDSSAPQGDRAENEEIPVSANDTGVAPGAREADPEPTADSGPGGAKAS